MITKKQFVCPYEVYDSMDELQPQDAELMRKAHEAARNAYAPYSKFHVGAAVRLANGVCVPSVWRCFPPWHSIQASPLRLWR